VVTLKDLKSNDAIDEVEVDVTIYNVVLAPYLGDEQEDDLNKTTLEICKKASKSRISTVFFPPFGTGVLLYPVELCAESM